VNENRPVATSTVLTEYRTRLWMGLVMAVVASGVLVLDHLLAVQFQLPLYPCLLLSMLSLGVLTVLELHSLVRVYHRPPLWLCLLASCGMLLANWPAHLHWTGGEPPQPWRDLMVCLTGLVLLGFLFEMAWYRKPDGATVRLALLTWTAIYLGLLPAFFVQLRWWPDGPDDLRGVTALSLAIFVPKGGDIGAYFAGRWLGRHRMTPLLSPKKTWEGLLGGLLLSVVVAVLLNRLLQPVLPSDWEAAAFGLIVGGAGVLGDLGESLLKRDCQHKDASQVVPGFGGVLDVVDSVLFAAPVAYLWLFLHR
jgi:phosphatidate cytidylyltransferase